MRVSTLRNQSTAFRLLLFAFFSFMLASCVQPQPTVPTGTATVTLAAITPSHTLELPTETGPSTSSETATPSPFPSQTPTITHTPTQTNTPTITSTPTLGTGSTPRLPSLGVEFIANGDRSLPLVALTFDIGQTPQNPAGFDEGVIAALTENNAPATFFLGGDWMRTHISETRRLDSNPLFELGNHSWSHPDMRLLNEGDLSAEILRTQDMMFQITGHQTSLFRLPSGLFNDLVLSVAAWHGLYTIQWDVVTADPVPDNNAANINQIVRERVQPGSIIVMHANGRGWHTAEALPEMIEYLRSAGYCLVTVSQMIGLDPKVPACDPIP